MKRVKVLGNLAFSHDIRNGLPPEFSACDCMYAEPPWKDGYEKFNARAGALSGVPYEEFVAGIDRLARAWHGPVVYIVGKSFRKLYHPDHFALTALNGGPALAVCYHCALPDTADCEDILRMMAIKCNRVCDWCCGYGRAGRIFAERGKGFTISDYDERCIGYVAEHAGEWFLEV